MSKVGLLWFNFSTSTLYPRGPVSSGLSLSRADFVDKEVGGHRHSICNFGENLKLAVTVTNRRDTDLDIKDIRMPDGRSAMESLLNIKILYRLLKDTIKEHYSQTFDFGGRNMAVLIDEGERFDDLKILRAFRVKLAKFYLFEAPIDMTQVSVTDEQEIPFFMNSGNVNEFVQWMSSACPSLLSTFSIS